ncbi:MAG: diguanylate cyclase [Ilumatobacteraceae bacterium]|jgi:diguanylate cyclase (GGDEF)-like protein|nr:diguanylate cyclase [Ilumatobacteraceae bacterium]
MVDEGKLSEVLSAFARTMITDCPMRVIADQLVKCVVEVLPVTSAGVTLNVPMTSAREIVASDESALRFEQLQYETEDGPCNLANATGDAISVGDLQADRRFPQFAAAAAVDGLAAVFAFPLRHDCDRLGAMTLYRDATGVLDPQDMAIAQTLADVTAAYLVMAIARDEARSAAETLRQIALRDPLTGLANRQLLEDRIEHAAEHARRSHSAAAILFADLDQFKHVNDAYGHAVGDELLVAVARRLSTLLRSSDTLARISGDEFVFLCEDLSEPEDVDLIMDRIAEAFSTPFDSAGHELSITASVGVAYAGAGEQISTHLVVAADRAMYEAKRARCVR